MSLVPIVPAVAAGNPYDAIIYNREETYDFDESKIEKWKEEEVAVPPVPDEDDYVEVPIDGFGKDFVVMLDAKTMSVGEKDGVIRYWIALKSKLGAVNMMYEGVRCTGRLYKTYAYASQRKKGKFRVVKKPKWMSTEAVRGRNYRQELVQHFLCVAGSARNPKEVVARIKEANSSLFSFGKETTGPAAFY